MNRLAFFIAVMFVVTHVRGQTNVQGQKTVSGKVTDDSGEGLPGVTVQIKGTLSGSISDGEGNYSVEVSEGGILTFSFVGYSQQEILVGNRTVIDVSLETDIAQLSEVVVVGYGTQKKSDLTGSVIVVSNDDFKNQPITRMDQALQGRSAGVQVNQTSGAPGSGFKIRVRGTNSINGSNEPLYVVDGLIVGSIFSISVNDIKSLEVLKDASATAIYGSRGANGVVLITTKNGSNEQLQVDFGTFVGFQSVRKKLDIMSSANFAETVNASNTGTTYTTEEINNLRNNNIDWQDEIFKEAPIANYQLSFRGGSETTNFYVSGNYVDQDGIVRNQDYKRYALRTKLQTQLSEKVSFGFNFYLSREENEGEAADINSTVTFDPSTPVLDEDGNYNFSSIKNVATAATNPLLIANSNIRERYNNQLIGGLTLGYQITKDIEFRTLGGLEYLARERNLYEAVPIVLDGVKKASVLNGFDVRLQNTNVLTYKKELRNNRFQIDLVHEQQYVKNTFNLSEAQGFSTDESTYRILQLGNVQKTNGFSTDERLQSFVGRANYAFKNKFLFTGTVRTDGSSKFRKNKRWGLFPSASLAWKLSEENFIKQSNSINSMKLRTSYGITGSQGIDPLATRAQARSDAKFNYPFDGSVSTVGIAPSDRIENKNLTWETTEQLNFGVDIGLFKSRLTMSLDWYKKNTSDLLLDVILPEFIGANLITRNIGEVQNTGIEINLGAVLIENNDLILNTNFNFSKNRNEVLSLIDDTPISNLGEAYLGSGFNNVNPTHIEVGQPLGTFRGYIYEGVYQSGETTIANRKAGDPKYKDLNNDGVISADDITNIGNGNPDFTWGMNTDLTYKGVFLNLLVQGVHGNEVYNLVKGRQMGLGSGTFHAVHEDIRNSWTPSNPSNIAALDKTAGSHQVLSTEFLEDGSFIRFKNITLGYNFNESFLSKLNLANLKLYMSLENMITITDYTGYDPEISSSGNSDIDIGIDWDAYPLSKTITFGLNVSF